MTKETIMNTYAIEQGYESWRELIEDEDSVIGNLVHIDSVTDLIQEELKKKIHNELNGVNFNNRTDFEDCRKEILNTEIL